MSIKINDLSFSYGKGSRKILENVNCEIKGGTVNVLLGLNGCGKTTLIKILAGLLKPNEGTIEYFRSELSSMPTSTRSKTFAYVPQKSFAVDDYLVRDYLSYGFVNSLKFYESPKKEQLEKLDAISDELCIAHLLDKKMGNISGGERQIVTIASSLLQNTPIVLLDEPTSALDLKNQNIVLNLLKKVASKGKTIILSSHNPNHALFLNSEVILLNNGKIIKTGNARDLINKETLADIYGESVCYSDELGFREISFKS